MSILDNRQAMKKLDKGNCLDSILSLPKQCESAWSGVKNLSLPEDYSNARVIVFSGMGGSAYGARIVKSLYPAELTVPVDIVNGYYLPNYVDENSLVFVASYSGSTEETLSCIDDGIKKNLKMIGISSGGKLAEKLKETNRPCYVFDPVYNPSLQPRLGQGYMQIGQIAILSALGYLKISDDEITTVLNELESRNRLIGPETPESSNIAKQIAKTCESKTVILIGAEFLEGAIHSIRNPFHETGKHFADYFILPEANHHLLEGLMFPETNQKNLLFLLVHSNLYSPRIEKRYQLTKEVIGKNNISIQEIELKSPTRLGQTFELIQLGSFITFYLAMLHNTDPAKIPWVDYFKQQLAKSK